MGWFWKRSKGSELEDRLRSERPAPRPEFLRAVASRVDAGRARTSLRLRVALASALTLAMFVAVASVGGISYAAAGAQKAVESVSNVVSSASNGTQTNSNNNNNNNDDDDDADDDQYEKDCKDAVKQKIKAEQERHKAALQTPAENARHKAAMEQLKAEKKACKDNG